MAQGDTRLITSQSNFAGGIDSSKVATIASVDAPQGLLPSQLAWGINLSVRGGGIQPRGGWAKRATMPVTAKFQGSVVYEPLVGNPYGIASIGGHIYQVDLETYAIVDLSERFQLFNPSDVDKAFFCQGEEFLVIQAGDYQTLPLFWDGVSLKRSMGFTPDTITGFSFTVPAIGQPVLVTLSAPYSGGDNDIITIDGYTYQQVVNTQRYNVSITIDNPTPAWNGQNAFSYLSFPATLSLPNVSGGASTTLLRAIANYANNTVVQFQGVSQALTAAINEVFITSSSVTPADTFRLNDYAPSPDFNSSATSWGTVTFTFTPNNLAGPGANEVWLININDPRAGTVVDPTVMSYVPQLPAAGPMDYYMGRFWLANGREYLAGDIVGGPSGSGPYQNRDSILYVTENTYLAGGGTFAVPSNAGNITAIRHNAQLDTSTGQGILFIFTQDSIYSCNVPPKRTDWIALSEPIQRVAQIHHGTVSDRSIVAINGDLFFRSVDGVRSLISAIRYFGQWANPPLSNEETRVISVDDTTLLGCVSAIEFNSRVLMCCLPVQKTVGLAYQGIMPLDFDPIESARQQEPPVWEGLQEGLDILQLLMGNFSGEERAFAFIVSRYSGNIELWELTLTDKDDTNDSGEARITWIIETPGYVFRNPNQLKQLETARIWIDRLYGKVDFTLYWRNDQNACWNFWNAWSQCASRNNCEDPDQEFCPYPTTTYKEQYRAMMRMPSPPAVCDQQSNRPSDWGYSFQLRLVVKGFCRIRGIFVYAWPKVEEVFSDMVCVGDITCGTCTEGMPGPQGLSGQPGTGMRRYVLNVEDPNGVVNGNQGDEVKSLFDGRLWTKTSAGTGNTLWE